MHAGRAIVVLLSVAALAAGTARLTGGRRQQPIVADGDGSPAAKHPRRSASTSSAICAGGGQTRPADDGLSRACPLRDRERARQHRAARQGARSTVGKWNRNYHAVYDLELHAARAAGTLPDRRRAATWRRNRRCSGSPRASLDLRDAASRRRLFDQVQRDGANVIKGGSDRRPAHLHDRQADVYDWPNMVPGSDEITDHNLHRLGGGPSTSRAAGSTPATTSSSPTAPRTDRRTAVRERPPAREAAPASPARRGPPRPRLARQDVGRQAQGAVLSRSGSGPAIGPARSAATTTAGGCRNGDDRDKRHIDRYIVASAGVPGDAPGHKISPNLVGRVSASFALAAQVGRRGPPRARALQSCVRRPALYARLTRPTPPRPLVTALPHAFYPESTWRDDMELGAAEIALGPAQPALPARGRTCAMPHASAKGYIAKETGDTLNLYDTSALAHAELVRAMAETGLSTGLATDSADLVGDLRDQINERRPPGAPRPVPSRQGRMTSSTSTRTRSRWSRRSGCTTGSPAAAASTRFATRSATGCSATTPGASARWSASARRSRCACSTRSPTSRARSTARRPLDVGAVVNGPNNGGNLPRGARRLPGPAMVHCPPARGSAVSPVRRPRQPVRRRRPVVADRRAGTRYDRRGDHRRRCRARRPRADAAVPRGQRPGCGSEVACRSHTLFGVGLIVLAPWIRNAR